VLSPSIGMQVTYNVTASQNENAFFPQRCKAFADFGMKRRWLYFINAELNHENIGLGIDVAQNRPRTVVQTPAVVAAHQHRRKQFLNAHSEAWITGRRVKS
jgi:hypothetical protein